MTRCEKAAEMWAAFVGATAVVVAVTAYVATVVVLAPPVVPYMVRDAVRIVWGSREESIG